MEFRKALAAATIVGAGLGFAASPAIASHVPGLGFGAQPFTFSFNDHSFSARFIDFSYVAEVDQTGFTFVETGMATFGTFRTDLGQPPLSASTTGLGLDYRLYATFSGSGTVIPNPASAGVDGTFLTFNATIFTDPGMNTTVRTFTVGAGGGNETVGPAGITSDDRAILTGRLIVGGFHVFQGLAAGDFDVQFLVTSFDPAVWSGAAFAGPSVVGDINGVNTSITGVLPPPAVFVDARIDGSGNVSFQAVPEPGSLSLLGLGLLAFGALLSTRRQRVARAA